VKPSQIIDPADRLRLEAAVVESERATAGEIAVVVVRACDTYAAAGWRAGVLLAGLGALALASLHPAPPLLGFLAAQLGGLGLGLGLARIDTVRRHLVSEPSLEARVVERAQRAFAETGLARARGRTGILIFVALLERRVAVLADEGVEKAVGTGGAWLEVAELAAAGLRRGAAVEGLLAAIARCGEILASHVPGRAREIEELPAPVLLEDGG
jgi:putative membrane protein